MDLPKTLELTSKTTVIVVIRWCIRFPVRVLDGERMWLRVPAEAEGGEVAILYGATLSRRKVANLSPAWHCLQRGVDEWVAVLADESLISLTNYTHWELTCSPLENLRINLSRKSWYFGLFLDGPGYSLTPRERLNSGPFVLTWTQELYQKRKGNVNAS